MIAPVLQAIAPLVVLMALGAWIKHTLVKQDEVWGGIESIVYYVLMPALLFSNISQADLTDLPWGALLAGLYIPTLVLSAIAIAPMLWRNSLTRATRSSLFQGISRFNLYISLSLAVSLFDERSFALVGLLAARRKLISQRTQLRRCTAEILGIPLRFTEVIRPLRFLTLRKSLICLSTKTWTARYKCTRKLMKIAMQRIRMPQEEEVPIRSVRLGRRGVIIIPRTLTLTVTPVCPIPACWIRLL